MVINVVPDDFREIAQLVGHPITEQQHIMITRIAGDLKVEEIIQSGTINSIAKQ